MEEWEEYDSRLANDPLLVRRGHAATQALEPVEEFERDSFEGFETFESPFLLDRALEVDSETLRGSVGLNAANDPADVRIVQRLINSHLPIPLAPLAEDGKCGQKTILAIKTYQQRMLGMNSPDGRIDPGGATFRSLKGESISPSTSITPIVSSSSGPLASGVSAPPNMRPAAWRYLLEFTNKHEGAVFHMYNNRPANSTNQDVTCGVGFRLDPRSMVTSDWVKNMFFDPVTNQTPTDNQMFEDWDAAAKLSRTANNLNQYGVVCRLRMHPDRVYDRMALILRDQKLPALLKSFPDDFRDFANYPAAAQVFCVSFAYGRLPFDFPKLRAAIRENNFTAASKQCRLQGASGLKNRAHAELLLTAQQVLEQHLDPDTLPPLEGSQHEFERTDERTSYEAYESIGAGPFETESGPTSRRLEGDFRALQAMPQYDYLEYVHSDHESTEGVLDEHEVSGGEHCEHERMDENEISVVLGRAPARLLLHQLLNSSEMRQAAMAALLGRKAKRRVHVHGIEIPIPAYLRVVSHLCQQVAEAEAGGEVARESSTDHLGKFDHGAEMQSSRSAGMALEESEFQVAFDPLAPPQDIATALDARDWARALSLAIQGGMRDENELTNLIFFAKHRELPHAKLDSANPKYEQLTAEWSQILNADVWSAIQVASENPSLAVSGKEVCDNDQFYWGRNGKRLKQLVEKAAQAVDLNPGLLGTIIMAETRRPLSYLTSEKVSSYHIGTDDFYEARGAIAARVPAYAKVHWDKAQIPRTHMNDATTPREVKTILFDSGPDALLATAVYLKFREVRLREIAKDMKGDFDTLPTEVRFALTRMAMAAGTAGATPYLKDALTSKDILIRQNIPVKIYQTQRNATVRTAQALHLSDWIFGVKLQSTSENSITRRSLKGSDEQEVQKESQEQQDHERASDDGGTGVTLTRENGSGGGRKPVMLPGWAASIDPFPPKPILDFDFADTKMTNAFADVAAHNSTNLCAALVDLTGSPSKPPYAGVNDQDMLYPGSMVKIVVLYAAFALKNRVQEFVTEADNNGASTKAADIFPLIQAAWRPILKGMFPSRPEKAFRLTQDIVIPQLGTIFDVSGATVSFKTMPSVKDADIDVDDGEGTAPGFFSEWLRGMARWSTDLATGKCIDALGYYYINGALENAGFFNPISSTDGEGLWLSADYQGHDWVDNASDKKANVAGPKLTKRWADDQLDEGNKRVRGNLTATAFQTAKFMTLMAMDKLVDSDSSQKMRALLASAIKKIGSKSGIGSYIKDALEAAKPFDTLEAKKGWGNDKFSHECGIVERTVGGKRLRYVSVGLGSPPAQGRSDLSALFVRMDDAIIARNA